MLKSKRDDANDYLYIYAYGSKTFNKSFFVIRNSNRDFVFYIPYCLRCKQISVISVVSLFVVHGMMRDTRTKATLFGNTKPRKALNLFRNMNLLHMTRLTRRVQRTSMPELLRRIGVVNRLPRRMQAPKMFTLEN